MSAFRRTTLGLLAAVVSLLAISPSALAGQYDYSLNGPLGTWVSRSVSHDYSYLRVQNGADYSLCLKRNSGGTSFCGGYFVSHSYGDPCNPSSCYSWYQQNTHSGSVYEGLDIHDEWR